MILYVFSRFVMEICSSLISTSFLKYGAELPCQWYLCEKSRLALKVHCSAPWRNRHSFIRSGQPMYHYRQFYWTCLIFTHIQHPHQFLIAMCSTKATFLHTIETVGKIIVPHALAQMLRKTHCDKTYAAHFTYYFQFDMGYSLLCFPALIYCIILGRMKLKAKRATVKAKDDKKKQIQTFSS